MSIRSGAMSRLISASGFDAVAPAQAGATLKCLTQIPGRNRVHPINLYLRLRANQRGQSLDEIPRCRDREMRGDGGLVLPFFVKEQARRVVAVGVDIVRDTAGFGAGSGAMFAAQCDDLFALGGPDHEGCGNDDHRLSVARVVLFDMK